MTDRFGAAYFSQYGDADNPQPYSKVFMDYTIDPSKLPQFVQTAQPWVLDLGAADGRLLREIHKVLGGSPHNYIGVEINSEVCENKVFGHLVNSDLFSFLQSEVRKGVKYDVIVCNAFMYLQANEIDVCLSLIYQMLNPDGVFASTIYTNWRYGDVRFQREVWKEVIRTSSYTNGVYKDVLKSRDVSFGAPKAWWVDMFERRGFAIATSNAVHDSFYMRRKSTTFINSNLQFEYMAERNYEVSPGVDDDPFFTGRVYNPSIVQLWSNASKQTLRVKQKRPRNPDTDLDGWLISDQPLRVELAQTFVDCVRSGVLGPIREFSIKLTGVHDPDMYIKGATYFPKLKRMCRDVET